MKEKIGTREYRGACRGKAERGPLRSFVIAWVPKLDKRGA